MDNKGLDTVEVTIVTCVVLILASFILPVLGKMRQTCSVSVEGKEVFRGRAICVGIESAGAATQVDIGFPCYFPSKHWTNKDVKVETL